MGRLFQHLPGQLPLVRPLPELAEFTAHEQQLGTRVGIQVGVQQAQVGKALPVVARHLAQHGAFAVHHLVVGKGQQEILGEGVHQPEGELVVVIVPVHRLAGHVVQGVVHPAHVPLHGKAQSTHPGGARDLGPGGGFLGDGQGTGVRAQGEGVELPQELYGLQVLAAAVAIGRPLAGLARVIQVQHGGHRIHPQAIQVELLQPVVGAGQQEVLHLVATEVEYQGAPVRVLAQAGVLVLVQGGAVKARQRVGIAGKMGGHPVEDHADAAAV